MPSVAPIHRFIILHRLFTLYRLHEIKGTQAQLSLGSIRETLLTTSLAEIDAGLTAVAQLLLWGTQFTGKEEDEETKLIYFGARYYDARVSNWISTDPALGEYLPTGKQTFFPEEAFKPGSLKGAGGVYTSINLNLNHYGALNPVRFIDPSGTVNAPVNIYDGTHVITSRIGNRAAIVDSSGKLIKAASSHTGTDIGRVGADTNVKAVNEGTVIFAGELGGYGKTVIIAHEDKISGNYVATLYAHNSKLLVRPGQRITELQNIAITGSTGTSSGPHIHFEARGFKKMPKNSGEFLNSSLLMEPADLNGFGKFEWSPWFNRSGKNNSKTLDLNQAQLDSGLATM